MVLVSRKKLIIWGLTSTIPTFNLITTEIINSTSRILRKTLMRNIFFSLLLLKAAKGHQKALKIPKLKFYVVLLQLVFWASWLLRRNKIGVFMHYPISRGFRHVNPQLLLLQRLLFLKLLRRRRRRESFHNKHACLWATVFIAKPLLL